MLRQDRVVLGEHAVHGVAELVRQSRHVAHAARIVDQHPGREAGEDGGAEGAAALALADLAVQVAFGEQPLGQGGEARVERLEGLEDRARRFREGDVAVGGRERRVHVVAAQAVHAEPAGLHPEVALEQRGVLARGLEQRLDGRVGNVVVGVAHGDGRGVAAQDHLLVMPVAHAVDVDLAEDGRFLGIDAVQLPVGGGAQLGVGREGVAHQRITGELLGDALDLQREFQPVGEHRVERQESADAIVIFDIDDLLGFLVQRVGLEAAQVEQIVAEIAEGGLLRQESRGFLIGQAAPPESEEEDAVGRRGRHLPDPGAEREGVLVARVGVEPERGIAGQPMRLLDDLLIPAEEVPELSGIHVRPQARTARLEGGDGGLELREPLGDHRLARLWQKIGEIPTAELMGGAGFRKYCHCVVDPESELCGDAGGRHHCRLSRTSNLHFSRGAGTITAATPRPGEIVEGREVLVPDLAKLRELGVDRRRQPVLDLHLLVGRAVVAARRRGGERVELVVEPDGIVERVLPALVLRLVQGLFNGRHLPVELPDCVQQIRVPQRAGAVRSASRSRSPSSCPRTSRIRRMASWVSVSLSRISRRNRCCASKSALVDFDRGSASTLEHHAVFTASIDREPHLVVSGDAGGDPGLDRVAAPHDQAREGGGLLVAQVPDEAVEPLLDRGLQGSSSSSSSSGPLPSPSPASPGPFRGRRARASAPGPAEPRIPRPPRPPRPSLFGLGGFLLGLPFERAEHGAVAAEDLDPGRLAGADLGEPVVDDRAAGRVLPLAARRPVVEVEGALEAVRRGRGEEMGRRQLVGELAQQGQPSSTQKPRPWVAAIRSPS